MEASAERELYASWAELSRLGDSGDRLVCRLSITAGELEGDVKSLCMTEL